MYVFSDDQENNHSRMRRNPQQRKTEYRNLLNKIEGIEETEEVGLKAVNDIGEVLKEANSLDTEWNIDDRVACADETYLDCLVLSSASSVLKKCVDAVDVFTSTYDVTEYSNHIKGSITPENEEMEPLHLLNLLEDARKIIPKVPDYSYIYGSYDLDKLPQPKPKKQRLKQIKETVQKKEPEKVTNIDKEEETIEETVKVLLEVLKRKYDENDEQPLKYYDYIIDTDDFGKTVENMFYFSFLVRDGRAKIDLDSRGIPIIKPINKKVLKEFRSSGGENAQIITQINMEYWSEFKKPGYLQQYKRSQSS